MFAMDVSEVAHKLGVLRRHCEAVGRPFAEIEKSVLGPPVMPAGQTGMYGMSPERGVEFIGQLRDLGIDQYISFTSVDSGVIVDVFAEEVMPRFVG